MNQTILFLLEVAQGPLFRFAFALMIFGLLRQAAFSFSDALGAYLTMSDRALFWRKLRMRLLWFFLPSIVLRRMRPGGSTRMFCYHLAICAVSLIFRICAIIVPAFMVAHVYLIERGIGLSWVTLPVKYADTFAVVTILTGVMLFLMRLYSPTLRAMEAPWSFLNPLVMIVPFATGTMAMHPSWSPLDYHVMLLLHLVSAAVVFVMIPFARMLTCVHTRLTDAVPEAAWSAPAPTAPGIPAGAA